MICKNCGLDVPKDRVVCPNCDYPLYLDSDYVKGENIKKIAGVMVLVCIVAGFVFHHILFTSPTYTLKNVGIAMKLKYQPIAKCVIIKGKVLSCGAKREEKKCNVSYSEYKNIEKNFEKYINLFEKLLR